MNLIFRIFGLGAKIVKSNMHKFSIQTYSMTLFESKRRVTKTDEMCDSNWLYEAGGGKTDERHARLRCVADEAE